MQRCMASLRLCYSLYGYDYLYACACSLWSCLASPSSCTSFSSPFLFLQFPQISVQFSIGIVTLSAPLFPLSQKLLCKPSIRARGFVYVYDMYIFGVPNNYLMSVLQHVTVHSKYYWTNYVFIIHWNNFMLGMLWIRSSFIAVIID